MFVTSLHGLALDIIRFFFAGCVAPGGDFSSQSSLKSKKSPIDFFRWVDEVDGVGESSRIVRFIGAGCSKINRLMALDLTSPLGETMASWSRSIFTFVWSSSSSKLFTSDVRDWNLDKVVVWFSVQGLLKTN